MPQRLFFDLHNGSKVLRDETGVEAASLNEAVEQAIAAVEEIRTSGELDDAAGSWSLVVRNADGRVLETLQII